MENVIRAGNLFVRFEDGPWFGRYLQPFLASLDQRSRPAEPFWNWIDVGKVEGVLDDTWNMLGKWKARRAVTVDRKLFDQIVPQQTRALAQVLNDAGVTCLRDLAGVQWPARKRVVRAVSTAICEVSKVKPTKTVTPMFGSKTLHHLFPSVVPVFDGALVRDQIMKASAFREFLDEEQKRKTGWLSLFMERTGSDSPMTNFDEYFAFCAAQIEGADEEALKKARGELVLRVKPFASKAMVKDQDSVLWKLDGKVAEFCALGAT